VDVAVELTVLERSIHSDPGEVRHFRLLLGWHQYGLYQYQQKPNW
jgi:hypothetical protein